jgi:hypothetical protein
MNDSIYKFEITLKQQLLVLLPFLLTNIGALLVWYFYFDSGWSTGTLIFLSILFVLNILPVLILHVQYLITGTRSILIDLRDKTLEFKNRVGIKKYSLEQIASLDYYATYGHISKKGSSLWYTFDPYRFYKITFNDAKVAYFTCLNIRNIENTLEPILGIKAEWNFRALPLLY